MNFLHFPHGGKTEYSLLDETATMVFISSSPSETIVPIAAYSAQMEQGAEHSISMFMPQKILLFFVLKAAPIVDLLDFLFLIKSLAFSTSSRSCSVKSTNCMSI